MTYKMCRACKKEKPLEEYGRRGDDLHGAKICKACNRYRSAKSYARKAKKVYLISSETNLRDSNRSYFMSAIRHGSPFIIEDIYSKERRTCLVEAVGLEHSLEVLEVGAANPYIKPKKSGEVYKTIARFKRVSPDKDAERIADIWTNLGFKVIK